MPLFKLLLSQVPQVLEVSNALTFKGHIRFQRLLQKARHVIRQYLLHICFKSRKAQPLEAYVLPVQRLCSSNTQN